MFSHRVFKVLSVLELRETYEMFAQITSDRWVCCWEFALIPGSENVKNYFLHRLFKVLLVLDCVRGMGVVV